jgi:hypothetical protein
MMWAKRSPGVKYHNIIGVLENTSFFSSRRARGDGIVEYNSATMDDVESELVVNAPHTSIHMISKTIFEVRRILLEHLHEIDTNDRIAKSEADIASSSAPATNQVATPVLER